MTPQIALDLSLDGITVLSRASAGRWLREGVVLLGSDDMAARMAELRARCAERFGEDFTSILILPDSQILYSSLERDDRDPKVTIRALLKGRTPYEVEDLSFDFVQQGDRLQVAVVARETLREAETFAADFGFRPVHIVGDPRDSTYPGRPDFGPTSLAAGLLGNDRIALDLGRGFDVLASSEQVKKPEGPADPPAPAEAATPGPLAASAPHPAPPAMIPPVGTTPPAPPPRAVAEPAPPPAPPVPAPPQDPSPDAASGVGSESGDNARHEGAAGEERKDPQAPVFAHATQRQPASRPAEPSFASRRAVVAGPQAAQAPELTRITPRLSRPAGTEPAMAKPTGKAPEAPPAAVEDPAPQPEPPRNRKKPTPAALKSLAAALEGSRDEKPGSATKSDSKPPLPIRERTSDPAPEVPASSDAGPIPVTGGKRRTGGRLGLYMTLGLLLLLALVAAWSILFDSDPERVQAAMETSDTAASPVPEAAPETRGAAEDEDLALLLPAPGGEADDLAANRAEPPAVLSLATPDETETTAAPLAETSPEAETDAGADASGAAPEAAEREPETPAMPEAGDASEIYLASIDPSVPAGDAIALPNAAPPSDAFRPQTLPAPAGTDFPTDERGLVVASAEGTLSPGGYQVVAGEPEITTRPRPEDNASQTAAATEEEAEARAILARTRPVARPDDAADLIERAALNGFTRSELTRNRPLPRPAAVLEAAAAQAEAETAADEAAEAAEVAARAAQEQQNAAIAAAAAAASASLAQQTSAAASDPIRPSGPVSALALASSERPRDRPRSVEREAARIVTARREQAAATPAATQSRQTVRSAGGSVARAATEQNAIRLRDINLIGVYGRPSARRALVRLGNGRYVKVEVGDRLERGRVVAIGERELRYQQSGRNIVLRLPQG